MEMISTNCKGETMKEMDIIFLLDKSGSMHGSEDDTIGGFNSFIEKERKKEYNTKVTTILFDHEYEVLYERKPINEVKELTRKEYEVRGSTALIDAVGKTIQKMDKEIGNSVLFVITTDGMENSSRKYTNENIKNLINNHNWEFIFIGADIDSYSQARKLGIDEIHTANYKKSKDGLKDMFYSVSEASNIMFEKKSLEDSNWKKDLKKYDD